MKKQADRLRLVRVSKGMSQENVAKALDITVGAYSKIERGVTKLSLNRLADLANIFDLDLNEFIRYLNGEQDNLDSNLNIPLNSGSSSSYGSSSNDPEVALLKKLINLYEESKELNTKSVVKHMFENNNIITNQFTDILRETVSIVSKKLDSNQITNYKKGVEKVIELLN
jgi:transcriptional regulator with XRE-family HTH domain